MYILLYRFTIALKLTFDEILATTTSTTSTSTTTTTTTTLRRIFTVITRPGDRIVGIYNTSTGGSTGGSNGRYSTVIGESPPSAIDRVLSTKYFNFGGTSIAGNVALNPGANSGFYVTPAISNASIATALLFATANDLPSRDPITVTLEGTNAIGVGALDYGPNWTLIYSGPTGINPVTAPPRSQYVARQNFSNSIPYRSYRLLILTQRGLTDAVQYAEAEIWGYV